MKPTKLELLAGLFVAIILIICFALPFIYRLFALVPALAAVLFIFTWSKVTMWAF